jgi:hypothetical protein
MSICRVLRELERALTVGAVRLSFTRRQPRDSALAAIGVNAQLGSRWNVALYYNVEFGSATSFTNIVSADIGFNF